MKLPPSPSAAAQNCTGPVIAAMDGPQSERLWLRVYSLAGLELVDVRVPVDLVNPLLMIEAVQRPRIGFN